MISIEHYYEISAYSKQKWNSVAAYPIAREKLQDLEFLSADHSCLIGEKGVGKTVLACQKALSLYQGDLSKILYISLDDTLFANDSMFELAEMAQRYGVELVIFDEVHRYPEWKSNLKSIIDRLTVKTIISGSSILSFDHLGGLARRIVKYELYGLTFREYLNLSNGMTIQGHSLDDIVKKPYEIPNAIKIDIEKSTGKAIAVLHEEYLQKGYYAYGLGHKQLSNFLQTLRQATEDTIAYEIVIAQTHSRPDMARKLQALFKKIAQNVPYTIDYESLKEYAQISDLRTLKHYLACLQQAGIICTVDRKSMKGLRKPEKLYLANTCLYFAYADLHPNMGSLRETYLLNCLRLSGHEVLVHPKQADFAVGQYTFEIGGANKNKEQIKGQPQAFLVKDISDPSNDPQILPLWLFGFLQST